MGIDQNDPRLSSEARAEIRRQIAEQDRRAAAVHTDAVDNALTVARITGQPQTASPLALERQPRRSRSKFGAKPVRVDGHYFPSTKEATFYSQLLIRLKAGDIRAFCLQPKFWIEDGAFYVCDFGVVENDGTMRWIDVKGGRATALRLYRLKKARMRSVHGIEIEEV